MLPIQPPLEIQELIPPRHSNEHALTQALFNWLSFNENELNFDEIRDVLDQGADITVSDNFFEDNTFLTWIIANTKIANLSAILNFLREYYNEQTEIFNAIINMVDKENKTALMLAILKGWNHQTDTSNDPNRPKMQTAITTLLAYDADVNLRDNLGNAALHYAVLRRDIEAVRLLLKNGADISIVNNDGLTPLQMLRFDYKTTRNFICKRARVFTIHPKEIFVQNYQAICELFDNTASEEIFAFNDEQIASNRINKIFARLHSLFRNRQDAAITREYVLEELKANNIITPERSRYFDDALNDLLNVVNTENRNAIQSSANKYWDCLCQFVKSLFRLDRYSIVEKEFVRFRASMNFNLTRGIGLNVKEHQSARAELAEYERQTILPRPT